MEQLYKCHSHNLIPNHCDYSIAMETPTLFRAYKGQKLSFKTIIKNLYWWFLTVGSYRVCCAYDGDIVIHTSYVIPKCVKFPFLKKGEYEIGPCFTNENYRGKGIYPAVLTHIMTVVGGVYYMIVKDSNTPSIRGVSKAGFKLLPGHIRKSFFKVFHYVGSSSQKSL